MEGSSASVAVAWFKNEVGVDEDVCEVEELSDNGEELEREVVMAREREVRVGMGWLCFVGDFAADERSTELLTLHRARLMSEPLIGWTTGYGE